MILSKKSIVFDLWAFRSDFRKSKLQWVAGREYHSLSLRLSGEVYFETNGHRIISKEGSITFMPAGTSYRTEIPKEGTMMLIHFCTLKDNCDLQPAFFESQDQEVSHLFSQICESYAADGSTHNRCMALFYTLLDRLERPRVLAPRRIRDAKIQIDRCFAEPITIQALAAHAEMSEVHFRNEFKRHFGISPLSYLKKVRIENAKHLLHSGYHTVTEVAMDCGFESTSYFSSEFKRMTGKTPSEYTKDPL